MCAMNNLMNAFSGAGGLYASAIDYRESGLSIIPCHINKKPAIDWQEYQTKHAAWREIDDWFSPRNQQTHQSIGVVLGEISENIVAIDLDGLNAMHNFYEQLPYMSGKTLTVLTGSKKGCHLYFTVDTIPENINVRVDGIGGFELRGNGQYVIAPPSPHPSGNKYQAVALRPIAHVANLDDVREWFESMRETVTLESNREMIAAAKPVSVATATWKHHYLQTVISRELARIKIASEGNRNNSLFYATLRLANFCAGGELHRSDIEPLLYSAAQSVGMSHVEALRTIESGFNIGWKYPKQVPPPQENES